MTPSSSDKVTFDPVYPRPPRIFRHPPLSGTTSQCTVAGIRVRLSRFGVHFTSERVALRSKSQEWSTDLLLLHGQWRRSAADAAAVSDDNRSYDLNMSLRHTLHCFNRRFYNFILICSLNNFT